MSKKWLWFFVGGFVTVSAYGWPWSEPEPDVIKLAVQAFLVPAIDQWSSKDSLYQKQMHYHKVNKIRLQVTNGTGFYIKRIEAKCASYDKSGNKFDTLYETLSFISRQGAIAPGNTSVFTVSGEEFFGQGSTDETAIRVECKVVKASGSK